MIKRTAHYFIVVVSAILFVFYFLAALFVLIGSSGLNGSMHIYYRLSALEYCTYHFMFAFVCAGFLVLQLKELLTTKKSLHIGFLVFIILMIVCELYLQSRFVGKG
jgi:hypothetical protein